MVHIVFSGTTHASVYLAKIADKNHILQMEFMLDVGELKPGMDSNYRKDLYNEMFCISSPELKESNVRIAELIKKGKIIVVDDSGKFKRIKKAKNI